MKQYKIGDITVFGKSYKKMELGDLNRFEINPTCEFHILRHFNSVDPEYSNTLVGQEYFYYDHGQNKFIKSVISPKDIKSALKTKGTKFFPNTEGIETPKKLLLLIKSRLQDKIRDKEIGWIYKEKVTVAMLSFKYKTVVGEEDLIPVSSLSEAEKKRIKKVARSEHSGEKSLYINTIKGIPKPETDIISAQILETKDLPFYFITAYPSELGPDFPNPNQTKKEYEYNKQYWDHHVFVV